MPHAESMPMPDPLPQRSTHPDVPLTTRALLVTALGLVNATLYMGSNAFPLRVPVVLQRNALDLALGWHAWTIWPYWLLLGLAPVMVLQIRDARILRSTLRAYAVALLANLAIWLSWPTQLARGVLPDALDPATHFAWRLLYALDAPNNCFPSGHVTIPLVIASGFCAQYPQARPWPFVAIAVLLPSVVTTGQHSSWDILGGVATALLALALASPALLRGLR